MNNHYFIKAKAANSDTNLVLVTDKHSYNLVLHFIGNYASKDDGKTVVHDIKSPFTLRTATLQVAFDYPREEAAARRAAAEKKAAEEKLNTRGGFHNLNYTMSATAKDQAIAPVNVWDDGQFTYFKFAAHTELPNVYTINGDGSETLVNRHMLPDDAHVIVAERVAPEFVLRLGGDVVGVYDEAYDKDGQPNATGTSGQSNEFAVALALVL